MRRPLALATSLAALGLLPAAASASSTLVGHPQAASPDGGPASGTILNIRTAAGSPSYVLPAGIITAWRFYGDGTPAQARAKVFRPDGTGKYTVAAQSPLESVGATARLYSFSTHLSVRPGDLLGLTVASGLPNWAYSSLLSGDIAGRFSAEPQPADPAALPLTQSTNLLVNVAATVESDADNDGRADDTEDNCPSVANPDQANADGGLHGDACDEDDDNDGVADTVEAQRGTNPFDVDSDDDGLADGAETASDPRLKDSDRDGLTDGVEQGVTRPIPAPTAAVGGTLTGRFFPIDRDPSTRTNPRKADTDADGLKDGIEDLNQNGRKEAQEMSPLKADTDNDKIKDGREDSNANGARDPNETNPLRRDTDRDGLLDGVEDRNRDGRRQRTETNPLRRDTDGDGVWDKRDRRPLDPKRR